MKPGRNDPCPCGSRKKYKNCCLAATEADPGILLHRRVRRMLEGVPAAIAEFVFETYGPEVGQEAWDEFRLWEGDDDEPTDSPHQPLFVPWFFHRWTPDPVDTATLVPALHNVQPTRAYLDKMIAAGRLDPLLRRYLEACLEAPFSFYEVLHVEPDKALHVRDIFTATEYNVIERTASRTMQAGEIVYAQFIPIDGIVLMEACSVTSFGPISKIPLIELRKKIAASTGSRPTQACLVDWDMELREQYLQLMDQLINPPLPSIYNVDGEKVHPHRITFDIDSAQVAFDALKSLSGKLPEADLLESVDRAPNGELRHAQIDWTRPSNSANANWDTIFLASIEIFPDHIVAEVNSEERAEKLKQIIAERLGEHARHRATESTLYEEDEDEVDYDDDVADDDDALEDDYQNAVDVGELLANGGRGSSIARTPELDMKLNEIMTSYYENWCTEQLPALGGHTPLEMVNDPDGREMVEALILDIEIGGRSMDPPLDEAIPRMIRERLGLNARS